MELIILIVGLALYEMRSMGEYCFKYSLFVIRFLYMETKYACIPVFNLINPHCKSNPNSI